MRRALLLLLLLLVPLAAAQDTTDAVLRYPPQQVYRVEGTDVAWNAQALRADAGDIVHVQFEVRILGTPPTQGAFDYEATWWLDETRLNATSGSLAPDTPKQTHTLSAILPDLPEGEYTLQMRLATGTWDGDPGNNDPQATRLVLGTPAEATASTVAHPWVGPAVLAALAVVIVPFRWASVRATVGSAVSGPMGRLDAWRMARPHVAVATRQRQRWMLLGGIGAAAYIAGLGAAGQWALADRPVDAIGLGAMAGFLAVLAGLRHRDREHLLLTPAKVTAWTVAIAAIWQQAAQVVPFMRWPALLDLAPFVVNGLTVGGMYALIALGYTMVYGVLKFINFAHGDVFVWGGYLSWMVAVQYPIVGLPLALLWSIGVTAALGAGIERVAYRRLRGGDRLAPLITAIAVSLLLAATAQFFFGSQNRSFTERGSTYIGSIWQDWLTRKVSIGVEVQVLDLVIVATSILLVLLLRWIITKTRFGQAMRAVADDMETARNVGIPVERIITLTFVLGSALAAVGGTFWALRFSLRPTLGLLTGIKAFTAAVVGGIGSIPGAFAGGFIIGLAENVGGQFIDSRFQHTIAFLVLLLFLLLRPHGLFGTAAGGRR